MPMDKVQVVAHYNGYKKVEFALIPQGATLEEVALTMQIKYRTSNVEIIPC